VSCSPPGNHQGTAPASGALATAAQLQHPKSKPRLTCKPPVCLAVCLQDECPELVNPLILSFARRHAQGTSSQAATSAKQG